MTKRAILSSAILLILAGAVRGQGVLIYVIRTVAGFASGLPPGVSPVYNDVSPEISTYLERDFQLRLGPGGSIFFSEGTVIRRLDLQTGTVHLVAGQFQSTLGNYPIPAIGSPAKAAVLSRSVALGFDRDGRLIFNRKTRPMLFRMANPLSDAATVVAIAGTGPDGLTGNGGPATSATLDTPGDIGGDSTGNV